LKALQQKIPDARVLLAYALDCTCFTQQGVGNPLQANAW
jgi:hypothetical protein